jgi:hypothetical protein
LSNKIFIWIKIKAIFKIINVSFVKNKFAFLLLFIFSTHLLAAQEQVKKWIKGQVRSNTMALEGINITNASTKITVVSDQYGAFTILAKGGDILNFSAVNYEPLRKYISKQEFKLGIIAIDMMAESVELKEVVINNRSDITAENLGIIPRGQIKLTPAERKIYTANSGTDAILNYFSGRTNMLKKGLEVEKKEISMAKLEYLFDNKYYIETLKIPEEQIKGFQYYCVEDVGFVDALKSKNKTLSMFLIVGLASDYNKKRISDKIDK